MLTTLEDLKIEDYVLLCFASTLHANFEKSHSKKFFLFLEFFLRKYLCSKKNLILSIDVGQKIPCNRFPLQGVLLYAGS